MRNLVIAVALSMAALSSAQSQDILDTMAKEVCSCLEKKDFSKINDRQKMVTDAGLCMIESYMLHEQEAGKELGVKEFNEETGRLLGQKIGLRMANICPDVVIKMGTVANKEMNENTGEAEEELVLEGKISSIEEGDFIFYNLKEKSGKSHRLLWFQNFKGSDEFVKDPKKLVGKNVTLKVKEVECYIPKAKGYYSLKEIVEITLE